MEQQSAQESPPIQQLENSEVKFSVYRRPNCKIEFEVELFPHLVADARVKAIRSIAKEVTLPGFRKGKGPDALIVKNYPEAVDKKWQEVIADEAFRECEKLASIPILHKESRVVYKMKNHSLEKGAELTLTFETEPQVPTVDPKQFKPNPITRPEVNEEKVEETIRQTQLFFAEWEKVTNRPAEPGDFVILDVDVIEHDPASRLFSNTRFEITPKSMAKWMRDLVIGLNAGESAEGVSVPDDDAKVEEKEAFQPKKVRVYLKAIEKASYPPLDDAFAERLGVKNVEDLKESILRLLNNQAEAHVKEGLREQVSAFLLEQYPFELPWTLIEKETQFRMRQLWQDPEFQKNWTDMSEEERRKTIQMISEQSGKAVRMFYLCRKIIADAHLSITSKDLPAAPTNALEALLNPAPYFLSQQDSETKQAEAYSRVVLEKAEDYIIANAEGS